MKEANKIYQNWTIKTKVLLWTFACLMTSFTVAAQITATVTGGACAGNYTFILSGTQNGHNQYSVSISGLSGTLSWSGTQWEVSSALTGVIFYNVTNTPLEPPCFNNGTWVSTSVCLGGTFASSSGSCTPMPVELVSFSVQNRSKANQLTWKTANEVGNNGFYIERSSEGKVWQSLGFVASKGNGGDYLFTDISPLSTSYYRLRQEDIDGQTNFSKTVSMRSNDSKKQILVSPNPYKGDVIYITGMDGEKSDVSIANVLGESFYTQTFTTDDARISLALPTGVYFVIVKTGKNVVTQKMVRE